MINKRTREQEMPRRSSNGTSNDTLPGTGWEMDDFELDDDELDPMLEMQIELPLRGDNFVNGEPRVTVDYFGFPRAMRDAIVGRLHDLRDIVVDEGADLPRFLLFEGQPASGSYEIRDLIGIISVLDREVRVETARADMTDPVRRTVEAALGDSVRRLRRRSENPVDDW